MEIAAIITAVTGFLGLLGAGIKSVITMILDAYKKQVESTEAAKNAEIAALNQRIERHMSDIQHLRTENTELRDIRGDIRGLRESLGVWLSGGGS